MNAGLLAGEAMLDADPSAAASRKYLILVSDGITYIWDDEATPAQENYGVNFANGDAPDQPILAGPDGWDVKQGNGYVLSDWKAELSATAALSFPLSTATARKARRKLLQSRLSLTM